MPRAVHTHECVRPMERSLVWMPERGRTSRGDLAEPSRMIRVSGCRREIHAKTSETVTKGAASCSLHTDDEWRIERALEALTGAVEISAGRDVSSSRCGFGDGVLIRGAAGARKIRG